MAKVFTAPETADVVSWDKTTLFLAGGISGCDDWQAFAADYLKMKLPDNVYIYNPRRPIDIDPTHEPSAREQITWEFDQLSYADAIMFWFPAGGPNPIALVELGKALVQQQTRGRNKAEGLFIGVDPNNARALDIKIQVQLMYPEFQIFDNLHTMLHSLAYQYTE